MQIRQVAMPTNKYSIKCPYAMTAAGICIHNTANDASAANEINYMINNNSQTSYHVAVDDKEVIECIPFNRNAWHAGDGAYGDGNRKYIAIEICYSKSGGDRFIQAEKNCAAYVAKLLKERGWDVSYVKKHQDFSGKYCPHRTLDMGWDRFINMIKKELGEEIKMGFANKFNVLSHNGQTIKVYVQQDDMDIGLMSAAGNPDYKALQTIDKIDNDLEHWCKVNCNYFIMTSGNDYGQHLGVEQSFTMDLAPKDDGYLVVWIDKENMIHWDKSSNYWLSKDDVKLAFTPSAVMLADGQELSVYSANLGDKRSIANTQTLLLQCADGKYAFAVVTGSLNLYQCRDFAKSYGCTFMCAMDSGGSSQMIREGLKEVYTGRAIANVLTFYKVINPVDPEPEPTPDPGVPDEEYEALKKEYEDLQVENGNLKKQIDDLSAKIETLTAVNDDLELKVDQAIQILEGE